MGATAALHVNARPTTSIESIPPLRSIEGVAVTLSGSGTDRDGFIVAWEWRSDRDGLLDITATLALGNLSVGTHTLTFRGQDDSGAWSEPAPATLVVEPRPGDDGGIPALSLVATLAAVGVALRRGRCTA